MGVNFEVNMNDFLPLRDVVFNTLRQAILRGELQPGERLLEIHLANKLGVSRTPIREAIRKLELEGLVLMIPRRGAVVAEITEKFVFAVCAVGEDLCIRFNNADGKAEQLCHVLCIFLTFFQKIFFHSFSPSFKMISV